MHATGSCFVHETVGPAACDGNENIPNGSRLASRTRVAFGSAQVPSLAAGTSRPGGEWNCHPGLPTTRMELECDDAFSKLRYFSHLFSSSRGTSSPLRHRSALSLLLVFLFLSFSCGCVCSCVSLGYPRQNHKLGTRGTSSSNPVVFATLDSRRLRLYIYPLEN
ncbi:hypothetical protein GGS23DRAFT_137074 [Durotheca rogersii]|uniref:uncharacterized protein n=1 Tax=Durotheca rogersii TaxID=419775 RepID=UPI002220C87B|nr:uncharacterized protein GGS23DRAFT_137074 [Durotheca rogersii]KAI5861508.1 hypothetical protein GGS23DRAFT_137074 [Durotheca rogersii]